MTLLIDSIGEVADQFDAIVLDQWGVLHDGSAPYPGARAAMDILRECSAKIGVLSNSGKRAAPNADRIAGMGFDAAAFDCVMTSGEALWRSFLSGEATAQQLFPIEGRAGDAAKWADGLAVRMVETPDAADAILLMGLPDEAVPGAYYAQLENAYARGLPLYCSNPDFTSPRGEGTYVMSPGALASHYAEMGGKVHLYGKPHLAIFTAMEAALGCSPERILMVGDSLHHDILGAQTAGWGSLLIRGGIHAPEIQTHNVAADVGALARAAAMPPPDYSLQDLR